jgi:predicted nucleic acid-binding protein
LQEKANYFLIDDLDARQIVKDYNLEIYGSIGIILRSFRESIVSQDKAIDRIRELKSKSSLFITQDLIIVKDINN